MKLSKKILLGILPITVVGTIVPAAVSCGITTIEIEYGSVVNCLNKNDRKDFHEINVIRKSIQNYVDVAPAQTLSYSGEGFAQIWYRGDQEHDPAKKDSGKKLLYYDLIAGRVLNGTPIDLSWFDDKGNIQIQYEETGKTKTTYKELTYRNKNGKLTIHGETVDGQDQEICESWTYRNCTIIE